MTCNHTNNLKEQTGGPGTRARTAITSYPTFLWIPITMPDDGTYVTSENPHHLHSAPNIQDELMESSSISHRFVSHSDHRPFLMISDVRNSLTFGQYRLFRLVVTILNDSDFLDNTDRIG